MEAFGASLATRADLNAAIAAEIDGPPELLPSRVAEAVIRQHQQEYTTLLRAELASRTRLERGELVWASKARLHARPILALPFRDRAVLRALVHDVTGPAPSREERAEAYRDFQMSVLGQGVAWIAQADVAAFFQFIDHEALADDVVMKTAKADTATHLREALSEVTGRAFGLPQNLWSSRLLAEFYLQPVERDLAQLGFRVTRNSDDFRIGANSAPEAFKAIEQLQYLLYDRGLTLNEAKSRVTPVAAYRASIDRLKARINSAVAAVEVNPAILDPYSGVEITSPTPDIAQAATQLFADAFDTRVSDIRPV